MERRRSITVWKEHQSVGEESSRIKRQVQLVQHYISFTTQSKSEYLAGKPIETKT